MEDLTDEQVIEETLSAYKQYRDYALKEYYTPRLVKWEALPEIQRKLVPSYSSYLSNLKRCISLNADFIEGAVEFFEHASGIQGSVSRPVSRSNMEKVVSMLAQLYREWSAEASSERDILLSRLIPFLSELQGNSSSEDPLEILVPGLGTARLIADLVMHGYRSEGNEYSYYMIIMSMFMLNGGLSSKDIEIYPFVHTNSHWKERNLMFKPIRIPDFDIQSELAGNNLMQISMGSFVDCYGPNEGILGSSHYNINQEMNLKRLNSKSTKDVVVTNFFLDTSGNVIDYLLAIEHVLRPGGTWINFGPLVYHHENDNDSDINYEVDPYSGERTDHSPIPMKGIELTVDEIVAVALKLGFTMLKREDGILSGYGQLPFPESGLNGLPGYRCSYWVMKKSTDLVEGAL
ncbi:Carnosine N-methyltransferase [Nakaseomyces glabratus]|nr:Carnosine N-methyltransferase [Nakaseomyces glabratus]KTB25774.1 Carnosine N-methyltransferase [Nakaseomyces glabratus]